MSDCTHANLKRVLCIWWSGPEPLYEMECPDCGWWGGLCREKTPNQYYKRP